MGSAAHEKLDVCSERDCNNPGVLPCKICKLSWCKIGGHSDSYDYCCYHNYVMSIKKGMETLKAASSQNAKDTWQKRIDRKMNTIKKFEHRYAAAIAVSPI